MTPTTVTPRRIRLSRKKGFRLADASDNPNGVVNVARPGKWGNPYRVVPIPTTEEGFTRLVNSDRFVVCDRAVAVHLFEEDLEAGELPYTVEDVQRELAGKDLACWCAEGEPCHADVQIAVANRGAVTA